MRVLVVALFQGPGDSHFNAEGIHIKMETLTKRWKHLHSLAAERWGRGGGMWAGSGMGMWVGRIGKGGRREEGEWGRGGVSQLSK